MVKSFRERKHLPQRYVAKCPESRQYLHMSCTSLTSDRNWAWAGVYSQITPMQQTYPLGAQMTIMEDDRHV